MIYHILCEWKQDIVLPLVDAEKYVGLKWASLR